MEIGYALYIIIGFLGLVFGSYAGATVWRLRARQLTDEARMLDELKVKAKTKEGLKPDEQEALEYLEDERKGGDTAELKRLAPLIGVKTKDDRSHCLKCHHVLRWYDLVPLMSWLSTGGKCRYCKRPIGWFEPLMELGTAAVFVTFTYLWVSGFGLSIPGIILLALWLSALVMLIILFAYDLKWFLLPDKVMFPLIGLSFVIVGVTYAVSGTAGAAMVISTIASVMILGGLYLVLWLVSKGQWVGFGDVKLGLALGLLLMDWKLALLTLLLANLIGTLIVLPGLATKKLTRKSHVPFGPLLIAGFLISLLFGAPILQAYDDASMWLSMTMLML